MSEIPQTSSSSKNLDVKGGLLTQLDNNVSKNEKRVNNDIAPVKSSNTTTQENKTNSLVGTLSNNLDNGKTQKSKNILDNQGRKLSKQTQEYFKDSKAVDDEGKLQSILNEIENNGKITYNEDGLREKALELYEGINRNSKGINNNNENSGLTVRYSFEGIVPFEGRNTIEENDSIYKRISDFNNRSRSNTRNSIYNDRGVDTNKVFFFYVLRYCTS